MANNLAVQILINARDLASGVINKIKGSLASLAATLGGGGLFGSSINEAANFEQAMANVAAISGATGDDFKRLSQQARDLGASTRFSAAEAAEGMRYLAMAGFETNEVIGAMPGLLDLAAAGATDLGTASDIASNILSGFGIEATEMGRVADVLAGTFTKSNTTLQSLGETMKYVAPVAAVAGVSLENAAAMAGKLGDAGIQGSEAGTALRAMFVRLASPTGAAAAQLEEFGVATKDSQGNIRPLTEILAELDRAMSSLGSADKIDAAATIFGVEAASASLILTAKAANGELTALSDAIKRQGIAAEIAKKQNDTMQGALKVLGSAFSEIKIAFGERFLDPFTEQILAAANAIVEFSQSPAFAKIRQAFIDAFAAAAEYVRAFFAEFDWDKFANDISTFVQKAVEGIKDFNEALELGRKTALVFIGMGQSLGIAIAAIEVAFWGLAAVVGKVMATLVGISASGARGILSALGPIGTTIMMLTEGLQKIAGVDMGVLAESLSANADVHFRKAQEAIDRTADRAGNLSETVRQLNQTTGDTSGTDRAAASIGKLGDSARASREDLERELAAMSAEIHTLEQESQSLRLIGDVEGADEAQRKLDMVRESYRQLVDTVNQSVTMASLDEALAKTYDPTATAEANALAEASLRYAQALQTVGRENGATAEEVAKLKQTMEEAGQAYNARVTEMERYRAQARAIQVAQFELSIAQRDYNAALRKASDGDIQAQISLAALSERLQAAKDDHDRLALSMKQEMGLELNTSEFERLIQLTDEAEDAQRKLTEAQNQSSANAGSTHAEQVNAMANEIDRLQDAYRSLYVAGDDIGAAKVIEQIKQLQAEYSLLVRDSGANAAALAEAKKAASGSIGRSIGEISNEYDALRRQASETWDQGDDIRDMAGAFDDVSARTRELSEELNKVDTSTIESFITTLETKLEALRTQPTSVEVTAEIAETEANLDQLQKHLEALKSREAAIVGVTADTTEAESKITAVAEYTPPAMTVPVTADTAEARAQMDDLQTPTASLHSVDPDTARAEAAIKALEKNTRSTHTVYVRKVETNATGGMVGAAVLRRASGGNIFKPLSGTTVPGSGDRDTVPRALPAGSFVIRKAASRAYAPLIDTLLTPGERVIPPRLVRSHPGFWQALNDMDIPRFNTGGVVGGAPAAATTTGGTRDSIDINLQVGPQRVQVQGARDQANALAGALRALSRGA